MPSMGSSGNASSRGADVKPISGRAAPRRRSRRPTSTTSSPPNPAEAHGSQPGTGGDSVSCGVRAETTCARCSPAWNKGNAPTPRAAQLSCLSPVVTTMASARFSTETV